MFGGRSAAYPQADTPTMRQVFGGGLYGCKRNTSKIYQSCKNCWQMELLFFLNVPNVNKHTACNYYKQCAYYILCLTFKTFLVNLF